MMYQEELKLIRTFPAAIYRVTRPIYQDDPQMSVLGSTIARIISSVTMISIGKRMRERAYAEVKQILGRALSTEG